MSPTRILCHKVSPMDVRCAAIPLKIGPICFPETSVTGYQPAPRCSARTGITSRRKPYILAVFHHIYQKTYDVLTVYALPNTQMYTGNSHFVASNTRENMNIRIRPNGLSLLKLTHVAECTISLCDWFPRQYAVFMSHFSQQPMLVYLAAQQLTAVLWLRSKALTLRAWVGPLIFQ